MPDNTMEEPDYYWAAYKFLDILSSLGVTTYLLHTDLYLYLVKMYEDDHE